MDNQRDRRAGGIRRPFLTRLARDRAGNTLAIVGAALIPLTAMIGSGVDMSRAYMAKSRLQNACDAAALAGRRVMTNDTVNQTVIDEARRFFNFNFQQGLYQTSAFTPAVTRSGVGTVRVAATTNIPTSIMGIFGISGIPLSVECDASLNYVNTDVMMVLDVTGSMAEDLNGTQKMVALREAVMALYDALAPTQTQLEAAGMRLRYGAVPYSQTVNVGNLLNAINPNYLADSVEYQTVVGNYSTPVYTGTAQPPEAPVVQVFNNGAGISQADCDLYGQNRSFSGFSPSATTGGGPPPAATWSRTFSNNEAAGSDWGWSGAADTGGSTRSCRRRYVETDTTYVTEYTLTNWSYEGESIDVSQYKRGNPVTVSTNLSTGQHGRVPAADPSLDPLEIASRATGVTTTTLTWNGCIEERQTVASINTNSGFNVPPDAFDLDINMIPNADDDTRWRPMFRDIVFRRPAGNVSTTNGGSVTYMNGTPCPAAARRLNTMSRTAMQNYVNGLQPVGSTYHDIGMIWGARMLSSGGVFADSPDTFNNMPVARHIIFMTDGQLAPSCGTYGAYGIEQNSPHRVTGASNCPDLYNRHLQRFRMACNQARGLNMSIWVIAFGTALTQDMIDCASNANQASTAANRQQLIDRFTQIGQNIGALRLVQ
jgi:Flp pilus assembly protein TadG